MSLKNLYPHLLVTPLSARGKTEVAQLFESRGVLFNPRYNLTGRTSAYGALRDFMETDEEDDEELARSQADELQTPAPVPKKDHEAGLKAKIKVLQAEWDQVTQSMSLGSSHQSAPVDSEDSRGEKMTIYGSCTCPKCTKLRDILDRLMVDLLPWGQYVARRYLPSHITNEDDVRDVVQKALSVWVDHIFKSRSEIEAGGPGPDLFTGAYPTGGPRNILADLTKYISQVAGSFRNTKIRQNKIAPMDPLADENRGEGDEEQNPGMEVTSDGDPSSDLEQREQTDAYMNYFQTIVKDLRRSPSYQREADLLDAMLSMSTDNPKELMQELGWSSAQLRKTRAILGDYVKRRIKENPALNTLSHLMGESARRLCLQHPVFNLIFEGSFLPEIRNSLAEIRERFDKAQAMG